LHVLASIYCDTDKESNQIPGKKPVLYLMQIWYNSS